MYVQLDADIPSPIVGFERIHRYLDFTTKKVTAKIKPGEYYLTKEDEIITTVLGSCVAACIRDPIAGVGGMNHFMLPSSNTDANNLASAALRYGNYAMEHLINDIVKYGGRRDQLEFKIFGGANVGGISRDVGTKNVQFIKSYLRNERFPIASEHLGGDHPLRIVYYAKSGKLMLKKLDSMHAAPVVQEEKALINQFDKTPEKGQVELF
jgi:chemotaxis protein CheD